MPVETWFLPSEIIFVTWNKLSGFTNNQMKISNIWIFRTNNCSNNQIFVFIIHIIQPRLADVSSKGWEKQLNFKNMLCHKSSLIFACKNFLCKPPKDALHERSVCKSSFNAYEWYSWCSLLLSIFITLYCGLIMVDILNHVNTDSVSTFWSLSIMQRGCHWGSIYVTLVWSENGTKPLQVGIISTWYRHRNYLKTVQNENKMVVGIMCRWNTTIVMWIHAPCCHNFVTVS